MRKPPVRLKSALVEGSMLLPHVKPGMGAIERRHVPLIAEGIRADVGDSLNLDEATQHTAPNDYRWDYLLSVVSTNEIIGVEPHSAKDREVRVVIAKKQRAEAVLRSHLAGNRSVSHWFWVTRGKVAFTKTSKEQRTLARNGITFSGRQLTSFQPEPL